MQPRLYLGTIGLSLWYSDDLGESLGRYLSDSGLYSESRIWALNRHPAAPEEILAGTDSGIYRLDRKAGRFTHIASPMDSLCVWSIARSPHDPAIVLAGTRPAALFRSEDGGKSWRRLDVAFPETCRAVLLPRVTQIVFDPEDPELVLVGVEIGGVWRSRDGGKSFAEASAGMASDDVHGLAVVRNGARTLFATTNKGLHVSRDDGASWSLQPLDSPWQYTRSIVPRADRSGVLFLTNGDGPPGSTGRLLRSRDHGAHWEEAGLPGEILSTPWCVATDLADPSLLFVSTCLGQVFRSSDGGESWTKARRQLGETRALLWAPN
jgi:photosystem II stability/assembly factor-like uncharacterized protein